MSMFGGSVILTAFEEGNYGGNIDSNVANSYQISLKCIVVQNHLSKITHVKAACKTSLLRVGA